MSFRSWVAYVKSACNLRGPGQRLCRKPVPHVRLSVEPLEDRMLLSTFTVINTNDAGAGSLRDAITRVNADTQPGIDTINFAIGSGVQTIKPLTSLPFITHSVVIDGTSQPGFAGKPLIELDGINGGSVTDGLDIGGGNSTIKGLVINRFGGVGINLIRNGGNTVEGNYLGTDVTGKVALANGDFGVEAFYSSNNIIGGTTAATRNLISGNFGPGIMLDSGSGNIVEGNYIGTDVTGTKRLSNQIGVEISGNQYGTTLGNTLGGTTPGAGNLISGNGAYGVDLANTYHNVVEGNYIGTDVTGTAALGNGVGVYVVSASASNTIGGTTAGAANLIAYNAGDGVKLIGVLRYNAAKFNAIEQNSIFANGGLGIDLQSAANNSQAAPNLTSAVSSNGSIAITGALTSTVNTTFTLEFYGNPSGTSQGKTFLGSIKITTDASGKATFIATFGSEIAPGQVITATATDPLGDTSEFSSGVALA